MDELDDALQTLMEWGQYEAAAYRALVEHGAQEATEIVVRADIPKGRVYDVLNDLQNQGAVKKQGARPARYSAQNPRKLIEQQQEEFKQTADEVKQRLGSAYELSSETEDATHPAWVITGFPGIATQLRDLIEEVEDRLWIHERDIWFTDTDISDLASLVEEGVDVRIVGWNARQKDLQELAMADLPVYETEHARTTYYLVDEEQVVFKVGKSETAVVFRDKSMASVLASEFERIHEDADEVTVSDA